MLAKIPLLGFLALSYNVAVFFIITNKCVQFCSIPAQGPGFSVVGLAERKVKVKVNSLKILRRISLPLELYEKCKTFCLWPS